MANLEDTSLKGQEPNDEQLSEEDQARERSLQLGGRGPNLAFLGKYSTFLSDVWAEMKKVSWPTRRQVVVETVVVLVVLVLFAALLEGLDHIYGFVFNWLLFGK